MGRWSASHKKTAIFGWLAFVVAVVPDRYRGRHEAARPEQGRRRRVRPHQRGARRRVQQPQGDSVLIQSTTKTVDDPAFRAAITDVTRTVSGLRQVKKVRSPLASGNEGQISKDRHTALVTFQLRTTDLEEAKILDTPWRPRSPLSPHGIPEIAIEQFGVNTEKQLDEAMSTTSRRPA